MFVHLCGCGCVSVIKYYIKNIKQREIYLIPSSTQILFLLNYFHYLLHVYKYLKLLDLISLKLFAMVFLLLRNNKQANKHSRSKRAQLRTWWSTKMTKDNKETSLERTLSIDRSNALSPSILYPWLNAAEVSTVQDITSNSQNVTSEHRQYLSSRKEKIAGYKSHMKQGIEKFKVSLRSGALFPSSTPFPNDDDNENNPEELDNGSISEGALSCYKSFRTNPEELSLLFDFSMKGAVYQRDLNKINLSSSTAKIGVFICKPTESKAPATFDVVSDSLYEPDGESGVDIEESSEQVNTKRSLSSQSEERQVSKRQKYGNNIIRVQSETTNEIYDIEAQNLQGELLDSSTARSQEKNDNTKLNKPLPDLLNKMLNISDLRTNSTSSSLSSKVYTIPTFRDKSTKLNVAGIVDKFCRGTLTERKLNIMIKKESSNGKLSYQSDDFYKKLPNDFFEGSFSDEEISVSAESPNNSKEVEKSTNFGIEEGDTTEPSVRFDRSSRLLVYKTRKHLKKMDSDTSNCLLETKSILKTKGNDSESIESLRVSKCDLVDLKSFIKCFNHYETKKLNESEKYSKARENQLLRYYTNDDSSSVKFTPLCDVSVDSVNSQIMKKVQSDRKLVGLNKNYV